MPAISQIKRQAFASTGLTDTAIAGRNDGRAS
jgi:hypothetical protein